MAQFTGIWQSDAPHEKDWIEEVFGDLLSSHVTDGKHKLVLDNSILFDAFVYCHDLDYYQQFRGKNAYLVHFLDENFEGKYEDIYRNFRGVFRCFWSDVFNPKYVMKLPIGYSLGTARAGRDIPLATSRTYLWSFVGEISKSSRPDMAKALKGVEPHFLYAPETVPGYVFLNKVDGVPKRLPPEQFSNILFQSTFSPCPMGNVHIECFRFYESLECGSIPIVEKRWSMDYYRELLGDHPIPTVKSWQEARQLIESLIDKPDKINELQESIVTWWSTYKTRYQAEVAEFIGRRSLDTAPISEPLVTKKYGMPGWRALELMRHHDTRALLRRVEKQVLRMVTTGKSREAFRPGK
jgi:hypothetical protein